MKVIIREMGSAVVRQILLARQPRNCPQLIIRFPKYTWPRFEYMGTSDVEEWFTLQIYRRRCQTPTEIEVKPTTAFERKLFANCTPVVVTYDNNEMIIAFVPDLVVPETGLDVKFESIESLQETFGK